jgi:hypothetical protein
MQRSTGTSAAGVWRCPPFRFIACYLVAGLRDGRAIFPPVFRRGTQNLNPRGPGPGPGSVLPKVHNFTYLYPKGKFEWCPTHGTQLRSSPRICNPLVRTCRVTGGTRSEALAALGGTLIFWRSLLYENFERRNTVNELMSIMSELLNSLSASPLVLQSFPIVPFEPPSPRVRGF